jgi:hypothetical protein
MIRVGPAEIYHQFVIQRFAAPSPIVVSRGMLNRALRPDRIPYYMPLVQPG